MLTRYPSWYELRPARWSAASLLAGGLAGALVTLAMVVGLQASLATGRSGGEISRDGVNRERKGDRLTFPALILKRSPDFDDPRPPALRIDMVVGCEAVVSSLAGPQLPWMAGYCLS